MKDEKQTRPKAKNESAASAGPGKKSKALATEKPGTVTKEGKKAAKKVEPKKSEKKAAKDVKEHVAAGKPEKASTGKHPGKKAAAAPSSISPEERQRWIREAAFFRSQRRGPGEGNPSDDWAAAEAEIDRMLSGNRKRPG